MPERKTARGKMPDLIFKWINASLFFELDFIDLIIICHTFAIWYIEDKENVPLKCGDLGLLGVLTRTTKY